MSNVTNNVFFSVVANKQISDVKQTAVNYINTDNNLLPSMLVRAGEKLHKCTECNKAFIQKGNLTRHKIIHTVTYKCTKCDKNFGGSIDLARHDLTHTGKKPYKCTECSSAFTWFF